MSLASNVRFVGVGRVRSWKRYPRRGQPDGDIYWLGILRAGGDAHSLQTANSFPLGSVK